MLVWETFAEAFCLHGQTIKAETFRFGEVAARCSEIFEFQSVANLNLLIAPDGKTVEIGRCWSN